MSVWVNVWGWATRTMRGGALFVVLATVSGCIDDFDNPKGYGATGGSNRLDCSDMCDRIATCDGSSVASCQRDCTELEELLDSSGCSDEFDDVIDCLSGLRNVCTEQAACEPSTERFVGCVSRYCEGNFERC